ncbi:hypothetical protein JCM39068_44570 [Desulfocastanea catecholica]
MKYILEVPKGLACQCDCPECGTPLIAKKGQINKKHFAHSIDVDCSGETALHRAAKQILIQEAMLNNELQLPANQSFEMTEKDVLGKSYSITPVSNENEFFF